MRDKAVNLNRRPIGTGTEAHANPIVCFGCKGQGHISAFYPNKNNNISYNKVKGNNGGNSSNGGNGGNSGGTSTNSNTPQIINSVKDASNNYSLFYVLLNDQESKLRALVDSGATNNYISEIFAKEKGFQTRELSRTITLELASNSAVTYAKLETVDLVMKIDDHVESIKFLVVPDLKDDLILGKSWLDLHNPMINWQTGEVELSRCSCRSLRKDGPELVTEDDSRIESEIGCVEYELLSDSVEDETDFEQCWASEVEIEDVEEESYDCKKIR